MENFEKRIIEAIQIQDETERQNKVEQIVLDLMDFFGNEEIPQKINKICSMNIDFDQKLLFFMAVSDCNRKERNFSIFTLHILPYCFDKSIQELKDGFLELKPDFLNLVRDDLDFQKQYANYYKRHHYNSYTIQANIEELLSLPMFKKYVLTDEKFIANHIGGSMDFFESLPKEYGYLISLCWLKDSRYLQSLYKMYYDGVLSEEQQEELAKLQAELNSSPNIFQVDRNVKNSKITFILRQISKDEDFYSNLKYIQEKSGLDLGLIISFAQKYYDTELYQRLLNETTEIDLITIDKIEYLAYKIKDTDIINNLEKFNIEDLIDAEKEINTKVKSHLDGGPQSKKDKQLFFEDSESNREIRIIYKNGQMQIVKLSSSDDHIFKIQDVFRGKIEDVDSYSMPINLATKAAEELSAITYIVENEQCTIIMPNDPSIEQKKVSRELLRTASNFGIIGIDVFYRNLNDSSLLNNGHFMGKRQAIFFISNMGGRITDEQLDKVTIPSIDEKSSLRGVEDEER